MNDTTVALISAADFAQMQEDLDWCYQTDLEAFWMECDAAWEQEQDVEDDYNSYAFIHGVPPRSATY
jgi:hypothetical protein